MQEPEKNVEGEKEKDENLVKEFDVVGTEEIVEEATTEDEQQNVQYVQVSSTNPPHTYKESQQELVVIIKDGSDNLAQNVNPLTKDDLKKILQDSTNVAMLCKNPTLVRFDEFQKTELVSLGEKSKDT